MGYQHCFGFLNKLPDNADLSFGQVSKKFFVLLLILSARRKHTLTCIHIDKIKKSREKLTIMPMGNLKHSTPNWKEEPIILKRFIENPKLCVASCAECYIEERKKLSVVADKLIITHKKPYIMASRDSISRWVKGFLTEAGVNTETFTTHSCRSAAASKAKLNGVPVNEIMKRCCWSHESSFKKL